MGKAQWEEIAPGTWRLRVPGGWLYQIWSEGGGRALTFVPEQIVFRERVANALDDIAAALKGREK